MSKFKEGVEVVVVSESSSYKDCYGVVRDYNVNGIPYSNNGVVVEFSEGQRVLFRKAESLRIRENKSIWRTINDWIIEKMVVGYES